MRIAPPRLILAIVVTARILRPQLSGFDAAAIHPLTSPYRVLRSFQISGTLVKLDGYNIRWLIADAFGIKDYQIAAESVPAADLEVFYRIEARAGGESNMRKDQVRPMLQSLLAERFHFAFHRETRRIPVYALVVDGKAPLLKTSSGEGDCSARIGPLQPTDRNYRYRYVNCTLEPLIDALSSDRPIVDRTGLTGRYDIEIFATPEFKMRDASEPGDIRFLDAVRKLGLRLQAQNAPVDTLVVDHIDSRPTVN